MHTVLATIHAASASLWGGTSCDAQSRHVHSRISTALIGYATAAKTETHQPHRKIHRPIDMERGHDTHHLGRMEWVAVLDRGSRQCVLCSHAAILYGQTNSLPTQHPQCLGQLLRQRYGRSIELDAV